MAVIRGACARCGKDPAEGYARIDGQPYCHEGASPTCYQQQSWDLDQLRYNGTEWHQMHPFADFAIETASVPPVRVRYRREGKTVHYWLEPDGDG